MSKKVTVLALNLFVALAVSIPVAIAGHGMDEERLFEPLAMNDTHFFLPAEKADRLARAYGATGDGIYLTQLIPATGIDDHGKIAALIYQAIDD